MTATAGTNVDRTHAEGSRLHSVARRALVLAPLLAFLLTVGLPPPHRTQEARVLETAREMVGGGWRAWMVPHVNGRMRLQKPPLAYWLTAASIKTFGVSVWAGRLPMAIAGVLTLAATYAACSWLFDEDVAALAYAALSGCLLFARLAQHAETDILAALFTTTATYALWRAWAARRRDNETSASVPIGDFGWHHLAGVSIALATLAKGPPAAFPPLFLLTLLAIEGGWAVLWRFVRSGAPFVSAAIALPWFIFIARVPEAAVLTSELGVIVEGVGHRGGPLFYLVNIYIQSAPWLGILFVALAVAATRWRTDWRLRGLLVWLLTVLVPLSFMGQKQAHYTMFALPPVAILVGWCVRQAMSGGDPLLRRTISWILVAMVVVAVLAVPGPLVAGHVLRDGIRPIDLLMTGVLAVAAGTACVLQVRSGIVRSAPWIVGAGAVVIILGVSAWGPSLDRPTMGDLARELKTRFGDGPYAFYARENLPLVFEMRQVIPELDQNEPDPASGAQPGLVIVAIDPGENELRALRRLEHVLALTVDEKQFEVYRPNPSPSVATSPAGSGE